MLMKRTAQAGLVSLFAAQADAALTPDTDLQTFRPDITVSVTPPDLHACMVKAALDTAQKPANKAKDDGIVFESEFQADDGEHTQMVSVLREIDDGWNAGPMIYFKPGMEGPGNLTVQYIFSAVGDFKFKNAYDTLTSVELNTENLTGYTGLQTTSNPKADKQTIRVIHDNALYAASSLIQCMTPKTGLTSNLK